MDPPGRCQVRGLLLAEWCPLASAPLGHVGAQRVGHRAVSSRGLGAEASRGRLVSGPAFIKRETRARIREGPFSVTVAFSSTSTRRLFVRSFVVIVVCSSDSTEPYSARGAVQAMHYKAGIHENDSRASWRFRFRWPRCRAWDSRPRKHTRTAWKDGMATRPSHGRGPGHRLCWRKWKCPTVAVASS